LDGIAMESLHVGQAVTYDEGRGPKGPRAENVRPA
jgi:cold shock CspA family protein